MVNTNVTGMMQLTTAVSKSMKAANKGHIITLGSISGHYSYPGGSVYVESTYVESTRQPLRFPFAVLLI